MSQHPLVRIPGGCPAEDRRVSVGLQREPSSPSSQGSELSGIRSGSDGNRRGLTLIVDQKTRAPHEAKSSASTRSSFWGQALYAWTFLPVWSFLLGALRTLRRSSSLSLPHKASPCSARAAI